MSVQLSHQSEQGTQLQSALKLLSTKVRKAPLCQEIGEISDISASRIVTTLRNVFVGEKCLLRTPGTDREIAAQVVAIENERAILAPLEEIEGLAANTEVWGTGEPHRIHVGRSLIGRVIDGLGRPIDRQPFDTEGMDQVKITPPVSDAL
ncbi:MAG: hypothetical protein AAFX96_13325, partial [Pseudomonadota bacterium]